MTSLYDFHSFQGIVRLTQDVEIKQVEKSDQTIATLRVAIPSKRLSSAGEEADRTTFIDVVCFGKTAELVGKHFKSGEKLLLQAELATDRWSDKETGEERSKTYLIAHRVVKPD